jgi:hypothetical protein
MISKQEIFQQFSEETARFIDAMSDELNQTMQNFIHSTLISLNIEQHLENATINAMFEIVNQSGRQIIVNRFIEKSDAMVNIMFGDISREIRQKINAAIDESVRTQIEQTELDNEIKTRIGQIVNESFAAGPSVRNGKFVVKRQSARTIAPPAVIDESLNNVLAGVNIEQHVENAIINAMFQIIEQNGKQQLINRFVEKSDLMVGLMFGDIAVKIREQIQNSITESIQTQLGQYDVEGSVKSRIDSFIETMQGKTWPAKSIPNSAVNFDSFTLNANQIQGGTASNFSSTGLADYAKKTVISLLDDQVVIGENLKVVGDLVVLGTVPSDSKFFTDLTASVSQAVVSNINETVSSSIDQKIATSRINDIFESGVEARLVTIDREPLVENQTLNPVITTSNLQKLGRLRELDVAGAVNLTDTIRVANKRMGINTTEPQSVIDVWDQEVQFVVEKSESNTGYIGLGRSGTLKLGVNRNSAITISPTGVEIPKLRVGQSEKISISASSEIPDSAGSPGDVIFNSDPLSTGVFAWMCLEGTRWAPIRLSM